MVNFGIFMTQGMWFERQTIGIRGISHPLNEVLSVGVGNKVTQIDSVRLQYLCLKSQALKKPDIVR